MEYFKDVPGYEGFYKISNCGRVWSVRRGKLMSPPTDRLGYRRVMLRVNKNEKSRTVHSLVMEAFRGLRPEGMVVNHLDFNPTNNNLANLEYTTRIGNIQYSHEAGRYNRTGPYRDDKFTETDVLFIRSSKLTDDELAKKFKAAKSFINKIRRGVSYSWVK